MKTAIELITEERKEQIHKHGFTPEKDQQYDEQELLDAAIACIAIDDEYAHVIGRGQMFFWPNDWDMRFLGKIQQKNRIGQLKVAAALIAAEIDRLLILETNNE